MFIYLILKRILKRIETCLLLSFYPVFLELWFCKPHLKGLCKTLSTGHIPKMPVVNLAKPETWWNMMKHGRRRHLASMKVLSSRLHARRTMNPCKPPLVPGISLVQTLRVEAATSTINHLKSFNRFAKLSYIQNLPATSCKRTDEQVEFVQYCSIRTFSIRTYVFVSYLFLAFRMEIVQCSKANLAAVVPGLHLTGDVEQRRGTFELHLLHT